jgi:hypothetical protein
VGSIKAALQLEGDVCCYDYDRYGLVRVHGSNSVVCKACPEATTTSGSGIADSGTGDESTPETDESSTDEDDADTRSIIPLSEVADACRSCTDHAVRYPPHPTSRA